MRYPGLNALLSDPFAPVHGNTFVWQGFTYKVVVQDYGADGKLAWLDRNLGASRAANASDDSDAYGDLYQWGRLTDGHEKRDSLTTSTLSSTDDPNNGGKFILSPNSPRDWRDPQNANLWQGVDGINNPAPPGWRIPTGGELGTERASWATQNASGAFSSPLKLPMAGNRSNSNGSLISDVGHYWASTISGSFSQYLSFSDTASLVGWNRANGRSVRCVRTI